MSGKSPKNENRSTLPRTETQLSSESTSSNSSNKYSLSDIGNTRLLLVIILDTRLLLVNTLNRTCQVCVTVARPAQGGHGDQW